MQVFKGLGIVGLALMISVACGKSDEEKAAEKAAEETKEAAEALKKAAEATGTAAATKGLEEFAKAMEGAAAALGGNKDGKVVEPVSFQSLQTALPEIADWQRDAPTGERMSLPVAFSQAEANYTKGDANVSVKIVDSALSQLLIAPWSMFLTAGYEKQTSDGYEKSIKVGDHPGFERWSSGSKNGELNLVVANRFLVTVEGDNVTDTKVLHDFASKIDTSKLAALK